MAGLFTVRKIGTGPYNDDYGNIEKISKAK